MGTTGTLSVAKKCEQLGISQIQLAAMTGIPRTTLQRRMRDPGTFQLRELVAISDALGLSVAVWFK